MTWPWDKGSVIVFPRGDMSGDVRRVIEQTQGVSLLKRKPFVAPRLTKISLDEAWDTLEAMP